MKASTDNKEQARASGAARSVAFALTLTLLLTALAGCSRRAAPTVDREARPVAVTAMRIESGLLESRVRFSGRILSLESVMVFSKMSGRVTRVAVAAGDTVRAGDVLYTFETADIQQQVNAASAALGTAQAGQSSALSQTSGQAEITASQVELADVQLKLAQDAADGAAALYAAGGLSQIEHDNAIANLERARLQYDIAVQANQIAVQAQDNTRALTGAQVNQARTALAAAQLALSYTTVTAPIDGVVSLVNVRQHEMAGTQTPGAVLAGEGGLSVEFGVSQTYLQGFAVGDVVLVDDKYEALIEELPELPSQSTGLYVVKAALQEGEYSTGSSVSVSIAAARRDNTLAVPLDTVRKDARGDYVFLADADNHCAKQYVTVGMRAGDTVEIVQGLEGGETLLTSWSPLLAAGVPLLIVEDDGV